MCKACKTHKPSTGKIEQRPLGRKRLDPTFAGCIPYVAVPAPATAELRERRTATSSRSQGTATVGHHRTHRSSPGVNMAVALQDQLFENAARAAVAVR